MKAIFTLVFLSYSLFFFAQDLSVNIEEINLEIGETTEYGDIILTNTGEDILEIGFRLESICILQEDSSVMQICIGETCFFPTETSTTWGSSGEALIVLAPGEELNDMKINPLAGEIGSKWKLTYFDRNSHGNYISIDINIGICEISSSVFEYLEESNLAYPNPARDLISIPFCKTTNKKQSLLIYNTEGILQNKINLIQSLEEIEVNVSNYSDGIYFYHVLDEQGKYSQTFSFMKHNSF